MKKIYTKCVFEFNEHTSSYTTNEHESEWHYVDDNAPMSYCAGGGQESGGSQSTQTVEKADPWEGQQPYLTRGFADAQKLLLDKAPAPFYPGNTVVPFSPETNAAMDMQTNRAVNGSPIQSAGTSQLTDTLSGNYLSQIGNLYNNPVQNLVNSSVVAPTARGDYLYGGDGFNAAYDAASRKIIPQVDSAFERSGRTGSGLAQTAKTQALADAFAGQYGQERQNQLAAGQMGQEGTKTFLDSASKERDNQIRSMLFAPQMASLDYQDISKLAEVGAQKESFSQENLADQIARYDYSQNSDINNLMRYMNLVQGNYGGSSTGSSTSDLSGGGGGGGNFLGSTLGLLSMFGGGGGFGGLLGGLF